MGSNNAGEHCALRSVMIYRPTVHQILLWEVKPETLKLLRNVTCVEEMIK